MDIQMCLKMGTATSVKSVEDISSQNGVHKTGTAIKYGYKTNFGVSTL